MERRPKMLSGGQRQRVAMGRAIVRNPAVFLMDEPLSNLDAKLRVQMRADIAALQRELAVTTIYVTHDQIEAMTMGDRVAVMRKGVLQQVDDPQVLYDEPDNLFVGGFIGSPPMNMAEVRIVERRRRPRRRVRRPALDDRRRDRRRPARRCAATSARPSPSASARRTCQRAGTAQRRARGPAAALDGAAHRGARLGDRRPLRRAGAAGADRGRQGAGGGRRHGRHDRQRVEIAGTKFVASFSPRSRVRPGDPIEVGVDTTPAVLLRPRHGPVDPLP